MEYIDHDMKSLMVTMTEKKKKFTIGKFNFILINKKKNLYLFIFF